MTEIIPSLASIAARYDAVFCDLWGCLHNGKTPYPAAVAALQGFRAGGGKVALVTNATGLDSQLRSNVDRFAGHPGFALVALFGPEHGVRAAVIADPEGHHIELVGPMAGA